jgi:two-component system, cell cycle response regulator DivK
MLDARRLQARDPGLNLSPASGSAKDPFARPAADGELKVVNDVRPVLVVDDDPTARTLMSLLLRGRGLSVRTASDGFEALRILTELQPKLIFVDLQLPGMSGIDLVRQIRQQESSQPAVVVAVTASPADQFEDNARAAGCDEYLEKPIDTRAFPVRLDSWLSLRRSSEGS